MRRSFAWLVTSLLVAAALVTARSVDASGHYTAQEVTIESKDGTDLYAQVFHPTKLEPDEKRPVILVMTPYLYPWQTVPGGPMGLLYPQLDTQGHVFDKGYTVVQASPRGFGRSEGCTDLGGNGEQMDSTAVVEWAASQDWSNGKVGMFGLSYDAWTQVMALANDAKGLAAAIVSSPLISAYRGVFMNGVHYGYGMHATMPIYDAVDLASPGKPNEQTPECHATNAYKSAGNDPSDPYWVERDLVERARDSDVPVFWTNGFMDSNTRPTNFLDVYSGLPESKRAWFGQFAHHLPGDRDGNTGWLEEVMRFYDHHLKGESVPEEAAVEVQDGVTGLWREEEQWPPADARPWRLPVRQGTYEDSVRDDSPRYAPDDGYSDIDQSPRGSWTFSQPLPYDLHLSGVSSVDFLVSAPRGGANLYARMFDVTDTTATLITRGAHQLPGTIADGAQEIPVRFDLYPQDWVLKKGHRLALNVSGADNYWFDPGITGSKVDFSGSIHLPFLEFTRDRFIEGSKRSSDMDTQEMSTVSQTLITERTIEMRFPPPLRPAPLRR